MAEGAPQRVQLSRRKGWRLPPRTVVVARPTKWGNPFRAAAPEGRAEAVRRFRALVESDAGAALRQAARTELASFHLACWCPLGGPCHADVLLEVANRPTKRRRVPPAAVQGRSAGA